MQIQSIQSANNCRKPCFKAKFVNDTNGYFLRLWNSADKSASIFKECVDIFAKEPNHKLEIIGIRQPKANAKWRAFDIFNHNTGMMKTLYTDTDEYASMTLGYLLSKISLSDELFEENEISKLYNKLIGCN